MSTNPWNISDSQRRKTLVIRGVAISAVFSIQRHPDYSLYYTLDYG